MAKSVAEKDKHTLNGDNLEVTKEMAEKHKEAAKTTWSLALQQKPLKTPFGTTLKTSGDLVVER